MLSYRICSLNSRTHGEHSWDRGRSSRFREYALRGSRREGLERRTGDFVRERSKHSTAYIIKSGKDEVYVIKLIGYLAHLQHVAVGIGDGYPLLMLQVYPATWIVALAISCLSSSCWCCRCERTGGGRYWHEVRPGHGVCIQRL